MTDKLNGAIGNDGELGQQTDELLNLRARIFLAGKDVRR